MRAGHTCEPLGARRSSARRAPRCGRILGGTRAITGDDLAFEFFHGNRVVKTARVVGARTGDAPWRRGRIDTQRGDALNVPPLPHAASGGVATVGVLVG